MICGDHLDAGQDSFIREWFEFVRIPTVSGQPGYGRTWTLRVSRIQSTEFGSVEVIPTAAMLSFLPSGSVFEDLRHRPRAQ